MKYTWLDFIWGANLQFGGGGLSPPKPMAGYVPAAGIYGKIQI